MYQLDPPALQLLEAAGIFSPQPGNLGVQAGGQALISQAGLQAGISCVLLPHPGAQWGLCSALGVV
jgi:hypothetical protein